MSIFQHGLLRAGRGFLLSLSLSHVNKISFRIARVELSRAADVVTAADQLAPDREPLALAPGDASDHLVRRANEGLPLLRETEHAEELLDAVILAVLRP